MADRAADLRLLRGVRESVEAVNLLVTSLGEDLHTIAANYRDYAEINREWTAAFRQAATAKKA